MKQWSDIRQKVLMDGYSKRDEIRLPPQTTLRADEIKTIDRSLGIHARRQGYDSDRTEGELPNRSNSSGFVMRI